MRNNFQHSVKQCSVAFSCLWMLMIAWPAAAQNAGRLPLTEKDYGLWHYLSPKAVSGDGKWASYSVSHAGGDTLFVGGTEKKVRYGFASAKDGIFIADRWFCCSNKDNELIITDLFTLKNRTIKNVARVRYDTDRALVVYSKGDAESATVTLLSLTGGTTAELNQVCVSEYNPAAGLLAYAKYDGSLMIYDTSSKKEIVICRITGVYACLKWNTAGTALAFCAEDKKDGVLGQASVTLYSAAAKQLRVFDTAKYQEYGDVLKLQQQAFTALELSEDGKRVFWKAEMLRPDPGDNNNRIVQVWQSQDKSMYPIKQYGPEPLDGKIPVMWNTEDDGFYVLEDSSFGEGIADPEKKFYLATDPSPYTPDSRLHPRKDYRLTDLFTGRQEIVLRGYGGDLGLIKFSPAGKYISYFSNSQWWVYDTQAKEHRCLTGGIASTFARDEDTPNSESSFGPALWTKNDKAILLYDQYDIWSFNLEDGKPKRLTQGRERSCTYRFADLNSHMAGYSNNSRIVELDRPVLVRFSSGSLSGYATYKTGTGIKIIVSDKRKFTNAILTENGLLIYMEQGFDCPPALMAARIGNPKVTRLFQSNPHYKKYEMGSAGVIVFTNAQGKSLKAALFYPAEYDPANKYPMVVHIYDKQSDMWNEYVSPSLFNGNGFNISNFTSKGYFVLLPDISYEAGNPGKSATDCVVAAVRKTLSFVNVDEKRIGLIGHSFGGYETDFIITQTDMFAAAVSGAAITDLVSSYLYVSWKYGLPNFFHYEFGQLRMGDHLYGNYLGYVNNSPVYHARHITTPLLSWCGEKDSQVDPAQSFEFYLALRRLKKEHTLLVFPGQQHIVTDKAQQEYLTRCIEGWFGYYLKDGPKPDWSENN